MKKMITLSVLFMLTAMGGIGVGQEGAPAWTKNETVWEKSYETENYVYSMGKAKFCPNCVQGEYNKALTEALTASQNKLLAYLKVKELKSYEIISVYNDEKGGLIYILGVVPKSRNVVAPPPPPPPPAARTGCGDNWMTGPEIFKCEIEGRWYVYGVGTEVVSDNVGGENGAIVSATGYAKQLLKEFLNVEELQNFMVVKRYSDKQNVWVLGRVPLPDQQAVVAPPPPPPPPPPAANVENAQLEQALRENKIATYDRIPSEWWKNYDEVYRYKNVFRIGDAFFAIGSGIPSPKNKGQPNYWTTAERAAQIDAQRNFVSALGPVVRKFTPTGYEEKIKKAILKNCQMVNTEPNPFIDKKNGKVYVLYWIPIDTVIETAQ